VLSFLVTLFFTRVKKRVTRSSAGGVEASALGNKKRKNWIPAYAGMTSGEKELDSSFRWNDEMKERTGFPLSRESRAEGKNWIPA
jgi:hypothetical protein